MVASSLNVIFASCISDWVLEKTATRNANKHRPPKKPREKLFEPKVQERRAWQDSKLLDNNCSIPANLTENHCGSTPAHGSKASGGDLGIPPLPSEGGSPSPHQGGD